MQAAPGLHPLPSIALTTLISHWSNDSGLGGIGGINYAYWNPCQCPVESPGGCVAGQVTEVDTEEPLAEKTVILERLFPKRPRVSEKVVTDDDGCYHFTGLEDGVYKIKVKKCKGGGRKTVIIAGGDKVNNVDFECKKRRR